MRVIGTAGHVDHGKSTLVRRLTGIEPDRLAEEQARKLTIDLGFAWMPRANGEMLGIVDVPGHRDFIENMLAGVGGMDAVMLVIAADEGVMPQTREHLAILDLLQIQAGLIVITKADLIDDDEWLDLVKLDVLDVVAGSVLEDAPLLAVSAATGTGIDDLVAALDTLLASLPEQPEGGIPRLSVDRVFSISGFGTVVTGTLLGGVLRIGDSVELQPGEISGRVRSLQSYQQNVDIAYPGSRVAVNLSGVDKQDAIRGQTLSVPGYIKPSMMVDVLFRHLPDAQRPLKHNAEVKVFSGAAETTARVRLLNNDVLNPGEDGWLQLRLESPLPLAARDRFIMRYPSPAETIGGGSIVDVHPAKRWKRFQAGVINRLETMLDGTPGERLAQAIPNTTPASLSKLKHVAEMSPADFESALSEALENLLIVQVMDGQFMLASEFNRLNNAILDVVAAFHRDEPLRGGISREELRSRLNIKSNTLAMLLELQEDVLQADGLVRMHDFQINYTPEQERKIDQLGQMFDASPYAPPSYKESVEIAGEKVVRALIESGELVQVDTDLVFTPDTYQNLVDGIVTMIDTEGATDAKRVRDAFNTSRKYAIGLLEHLDSIGITKRVGDERVRGHVET